MWYRNILFLLFLFISIYIFSISSCQNEIVIPKTCSEAPNLTFSKASVSLKTDTTTNFNIMVDKRGFIYGDTICFKQNGYSKNAVISGYICSDMKFHVDISFHDTVDNSKLKFEGTIKPEFFYGNFYYCSNENDNCTYSIIGFINSSFSVGSFYTPLCSGEFTCVLR